MLILTNKIHISDRQYVPRVGEFPDAELQYIQNSEVDHHMTK